MALRNQLLLAGCLATLACASALGCTDTGTLLEQVPVSPGSGLRIFRVDQNGKDLVIELSANGRSVRYNHPNDRQGIELLVVEASPDAGMQELCIHSLYANVNLARPHRITEVEAPESGSAQFSALQLFSEAGRLWAQNTETARQQALAAYESLAALDAEIFPFRDYARLYAVKSSLQLYQFEHVLQLIDSYSQGVSPEPYFAYTLLWHKGHALLRQRQFELSLAAFAQALALSTDPFDNAEIRNLMGEAYLGLDQVAEGGRLIEQALTEAGNDYSLLARIHNNLGYFYLRQAYSDAATAEESDERLRASINAHLVARAFAVNGNDISELQSIENNLGSLYERVQELRKATFHYRESLKLMEAVNDRYGQRIIYQNLGSLNLSLGDYLKSRSYLAQAADIAQQANDAAYARSWCLFGTTFRAMQEYSRAIAIHEECAALAAARNDALQQIEALAELSEDYVLAERDAGLKLRANAADPSPYLVPGTTSDLQNLYAAAAREAIGQARALLASQVPFVASFDRLEPDPAWLDANICTFDADQLRTFATNDVDITDDTDAILAIKVLSRQALLAQQNGDASGAMRNLLAARALSGHARFTEEIQVFETAMDIYRSQNNPGFSSVCGELAIAMIEDLHENLEAERNGPGWSARTHDVYVKLADMHLQQALEAADPATRNSQSANAFNLAERSMAISLRQHLQLPRIDSVSVEQERLRANLSELANQNAALSSQQQAALLPVSYYHQHDLLELARLENLDTVPIPEALTLANIQEQLAPDQLVLFFYLAENRCYLFAISAGTFVAHDLGEPWELARLLRVLEPRLRSPGQSALEELQQLSAFLLPATLNLEATRELIIIPHKTLNAIPFSALSNPRSDAYQPLVADYRIRTSPSLSTLFLQAPGPQQSYATDIAVFADPVFDPEALPLDQAAADVAALRSWSTTLQRLPYTEAEAEALKSLFPPGKVLDFVGNRATLENLRSDPVRAARILHIATHGYFQSASSDNIGLVLSAINQNGEPVPAFVTPTELFAHTFNNELVVISGCDTAMGMQMPGEGMVGLTRGFIAQGVKHVISTLWPVNDRASYVFMSAFYRNLAEVRSVSLALQAAQNELKALPEYRDPYYWAPYVLTTASARDEIGL